MLPNNRVKFACENACSGLTAALAIDMKMIVIICLVSVAQLAYGDALLFKGELILNSAGAAQLLECGTRRQLELGVMASTPYFKLAKRYEEISGIEKNPVLVEVKGVLTHSSTGKLVLNSPRVISITQGRCSNG